uniref:beta-N-acetylhexosaminidase n=1 Tax=Trichobilharzia regenti TaxID=157069 RepID=A0AA85KNT4_TRIRE|nr:unnamed protein product [Trichobilharzia regenti]
MSRPITAVAAERLWSMDPGDIKDFSRRMKEFHCRMLLTSSKTVIPKVKQYVTQYHTCRISKSLDIKHDYTSCYILEDALKRFVLRLERTQEESFSLLPDSCKVTTIQIDISGGCNEESVKLWPSDSMKESYMVNISEGIIHIQSDEIWGTLHALETVLQLVSRSANYQNAIYECSIEDSPRFPHRGMMIDTARHYLSTETIKNVIAALSMVKMNVLHWHMTDDESFPYVSSVYPELSSKGAYHAHSYVYERDEIDSLVEFARLHGVRVIVEFDSPDEEYFDCSVITSYYSPCHTGSWGKSHPEILSDVSYDQGLINPVDENVWPFLSNLFGEVLKVFPDNVLHLGGSNYDRHPWQEDANIQEFMKQKGFDQDYNKLENYYFEHLTEVIQNITSGSHSVTPVVWQNVFENGFRDNDKNIIIQVHNNSYWEDVIDLVTSSGYRVINSACWSKVVGNFGDAWKTLYDCDPAVFGGSEEEVQLVIGGEVIIWGTYVDDTNLFLRSWPITAVAAERLWLIDAGDFHDFSKRLKKLHCQMILLNWNVKPFTGPGFCRK